MKEGKVFTKTSAVFLIIKLFLYFQYSLVGL